MVYLLNQCISISFLISISTGLPPGSNCPDTDDTIGSGTPLYTLQIGHHKSIVGMSRLSLLVYNPIDLYVLNNFDCIETVWINLKK